MLKHSVRPPLHCGMLRDALHQPPVLPCPAPPEELQLMRFFNTAGPVNPALHYCLDPLRRLDLDTVLPLIEQQKYFVLHAPRQTGKTSCLLALAAFLNGTGRYRCCYANLEIGQAAREDVAAAMPALLNEWCSCWMRLTRWWATP